ncbi:MAG: TolC family protein [Thermodesulfobacteriota bacterium]
MGFDGGSQFRENRERHSLNRIFSTNKQHLGQTQFDESLKTGEILSYRMMNAMKSKPFLIFCAGIIIGMFLRIAPSSGSETPDERFTLNRTVEKAIEVNLGLKSAREEIAAADSLTKVARSYFFPTFNLSYQYQRNDEENFIQGFGLLEPEEIYSFSAGVKQPLFSGFSIKNRYELSKLRREAAKKTETLTRQDVILDAHRIYFSVLKAQKLVAVSQETVEQFESQEKVAASFHEVGMTPLNDLLQAQAELANAKQRLINAKNLLGIAEARFNTFLRRSITAGVWLEERLQYTPFPHDIHFCLEAALKNREEIRRSDVELQIAEKDIELNKKGYYPSVNLSWTYLRQGEDWDAEGGAGTFSDSSSWDVKAVASWDIWEWGRTRYDVGEKLSRRSQALLKKEGIMDQIRLEVREAFLKTQESIQNIETVKKAIEQARENVRITKEQYAAQIATTTDVLNSQTLLSRIMLNYYDAIYDLAIFKATLYRAMGQEPVE